ncbi:MAG: hypothetical protein GY801_30710 [bacterium]|nr:hypothetical protein [bacterium]
MQKKGNLKRRTFLKGLGIATVLVTGGGVYRAYDQGVFSSEKGPAYQAWKSWRSENDEGPLGLVRAAILAANPHNTQPWLFKVTDSRIELFADTTRNLGTMDPYLREMTIGLGCAVENMLLAAPANGYHPQLTLHSGMVTEPPSDPKPRRVAGIDLTPGTESPSELYAAIPNRHTDRAVYDPERPVAPNTLETLQALAQNNSDVKIFLFSTKEQRKIFSEGTIRATETIVADTVMAHDSAEWFHHDWDDLQTYKDGPYIDTYGVPPFMRVLIKMLPPASEEMDNAAWLKATKRTLASSPVFGLIAVRELYDQPQSLQAGQVWQRMHLWASSQKLAMQPVNQLMEIVDRERQLGQEPQTARFLDELTGDLAWKSTFAFRLGHPTMNVLASARRPIEDVLL